MFSTDATAAELLLLITVIVTEARKKKIKKKNFYVEVRWNTITNQTVFVFFLTKWGQLSKFFPFFCFGMFNK